LTGNYSVWAHKTSLAPPLFNEVPIPVLLEVWILALYTILPLDFWTVPTVWYFVVFHFVLCFHCAKPFFIF